jgi:hypothetical protein
MRGSAIEDERIVEPKAGADLNTFVSSMEFPGFVKFEIFQANRQRRE